MINNILNDINTKSINEIDEAKIRDVELKELDENELNALYHRKNCASTLINSANINNNINNTSENNVLNTLNTSFHRPLMAIIADYDKTGNLFANSENPEDVKFAQSMIDAHIRDELNFMFANSLADRFDEAVKHIKTHIYHTKSAIPFYPEHYIRRLIGSEVGWQKLFNDHAEKYPYDVNERVKMRDKFLDGMRLGFDPKTDPNSPCRRVLELNNYIDSWRGFSPFTFGIKALDKAIGGIMPGDICVLTGAPGSMKTSLALNLVDTAVLHPKNNTVLYCSVDMAPRDIIMRLLERETLIPEPKLREMLANTTLANTANTANSAKNTANNINLNIDLADIANNNNYYNYKNNTKIYDLLDSFYAKYNTKLAILGNGVDAPLTLEQLLNECLIRQPGLVIIDYLTKLKTPGQSDLSFVEQAIPAISNFVQRYETAFLLVSQMSRASRNDQASGRSGGHSRGGGIVEETAHTEIELFQQFYINNNINSCDDYYSDYINDLNISDGYNYNLNGFNGFNGPDPDDFGGLGGFNGFNDPEKPEKPETPEQPEQPLIIAAVTKARRGVAGQYFSLGYQGDIKKFDGTAKRVNLRSRSRRVLYQ